MKLMASILTTAVITGAICGAAVFQPAMAENPAANALVKTNAQTPKELTYYLRPVVSRTVALDSVPALWREFEKQFSTQKDLPDPLDRFVVMYRNISPDFTRADVTIGFGVEEHSSSKTDVELPVTREQQQLLARGQYSDTDLEKAWKEINYRKPVEAVVETHYISVLGQEDSSQFVVYYK